MSFLEQPGFADDVRSVLTDLLGLPPSLLDYIVQYNALNGLPIPISQITGFTQFTVQEATIIAANESTATAYPSYTDLATVGPTLSGLPDGSYVFWFGSQAKNTLGDSALMGLNINGAAPSNATSCATNSTVYTQIARAYNAKLSNISAGSTNTVKAQYSAGTGGGTSNFSLRYLYALKYANN